MPAKGSKKTKKGGRTKYSARSGRTLYGRGAYTYSRPGPWGQAGRMIGRAVGAAVGSRFGDESLGKKIGGYAGGLAHYVGRIFGSGDYRIGEAPAYNSLFRGSKRIPRNAKLSFGRNSFRVKYKEYLMDVISGPIAGTFSEQLFRFNPGVPSTFPWLSQLAAAFETYKWHGAVLEFKTMSADALNSTNTALGSVIMAADYNTATIGQSFQNKQEMLNYMGAIDCKPSQSALMGIECDPNRLPIDQLYVRQGTIPFGQDPRLFDTCSFSVATTGFQAASVNVGELYIVYDVEFFMPVQQVPGSTMLAAEYNLTPITNQAPALVNSGLLGSFQEMVQVFDNIGLDFSNAISNAYAGILLKQRRNIASGSCFAVEYMAYGVADNCTHPGIIIPPGVVLLDEITGVIGGPKVAGGLNTHSGAVWHIQIPDVNLLAPIVQSDNSGNVQTNPLPLHLLTLTNTTLGGTSTVPAAPCYGVLRVWQINGVAGGPANFNQIT